MDITTGARDQGVYVIRTVGAQTWAEDSMQAHGVRLELMDGLQPLALCKLQVPGTLAAEEQGTEEAAAIEPWTRTLRYLAVVKRLRGHLDSARHLLDETEGAAEYGRPVDEVDAAALRAMATSQERGQADSGDDYDLAPLARLITTRLEQQIGQGLRKALAFAPDPAETPIRPAWELPRLAAGMPGQSLARETARDLLAGWAAVRDLRDPLIRWAVRDAEVSRTEVQRTTSVARTTINRLLPA